MAVTLCLAQAARTNPGKCPQVLRLLSDAVRESYDVRIAGYRTRLGQNAPAAGAGTHQSASWTLAVFANGGIVLSYHNQFFAILQTELVQHISSVKFCSAFGVIHVAGNFLVRKPSQQKLQNLAFTRGQQLARQELSVKEILQLLYKR